jgi:hypothetical protein
LWIAAFLAVLVPGQLAVGMRASATATVTGDEPFYLLTAQSLVSDGDLDLRDEYAAPGREMARFWDGTKPLWKQMEPAPGGALLSPHDPGLARPGARNHHRAVSANPAEPAKKTTVIEMHSHRGAAAGWPAP